MEPQYIDDAMQDDNWIKVMQEELDQFQKNDVWKLVELPKGKKDVGAKWVFPNKLDENGKVVRNKTRLVAKGHSQQEGINYKDTYAPVAHLEVIHISLSLATYRNMKLHQMDVKSAFFNGIIQEKVYVEQPPEFESETLPYYVFELKKYLYGLKQAPRAWYEKLSSFLLKNGFEQGKVDTTLFSQKL